MRKNGKMVACIICGAEFYLPKSRVGKIKCCSRKCANKSLIKQFCPKNHDTFITGRTKAGGCKKCERLHQIEVNSVQFCEEGHDTFVTGRYKGNGRCIACSALPSKQFCPRNHDTWICGRDETGMCRDCTRLAWHNKHKDIKEGKRSVSHDKYIICPQGHDKNVVGWGLMGNCAQCSRDSANGWYKDNTEYASKRAREYYLKNRERLDKLNAQWAKEHPGSIHNSHWKFRGVLNLDGSQFLIQDYDKAFKDQEGKCVICKRGQSEFKKALCADHDHKTGFFRGLLCTSCNIGLGIYEKLNEGFELYLNYHQAKIKEENTHGK
jgi:hypothetical protein